MSSALMMVIHCWQLVAIASYHLKADYYEIAGSVSWIHLVVMTLEVEGVREGIDDGHYEGMGPTVVASLLADVLVNLKVETVGFRYKATMTVEVTSMDDQLL